MTPSSNGKGKKTLLSSLLTLVLLIVLAIGQQWLFPRPDAPAAAPTASAAQTSAAARPNATKQPTATQAPKATAKPREGQNPAAPSSPSVTDAPITDPQAIADYLFTYGELPENFITKEEARKLGWDSQKNYVSDVAPGKSIGGDRFGNFEGKLPARKGRTYYEADANYVRGRRNAYRIVYASDGRVYYTEDHYNTFTELFPSFQGETAPVPWRGGNRNP